MNSIKVSGLREFRTNLRQLDRGLPKGLRVAGNKAADIVVTDAKPRVPVGPGIKGHALSSIRASSTQTSARVRGGGARFPYYPWLDFGGAVGKNNSIKRKYLKKGRYIWPAFTDNREQVTERLRDALVDVARGAGLEVR